MSLRVAVVTQDDPFYVPVFFRTFFAGLDDDFEVISVTVLDPFDESLQELARRMYRFYGARHFLALGLRYVSYLVADWLDLANRSVASIADDHGVTSRRLTSVNTSSFRRYLEDQEVDVVLSVAAPEVFAQPLLETPEWGCLNVHTASLPEYRGMLPTFWALYYGDDEIGVTVHTMSEELDHGEIVRQTTFPVEEEDSLDDVIREGKRVGGELAAAALADIAEGDVDLRPMEGEGSYHTFPTREERREFQRRGGRLL